MRPVQDITNSLIVQKPPTTSSGIGYPNHTLGRGHLNTIDGKLYSIWKPVERCLWMLVVLDPKNYVAPFNSLAVILGKL